MKQFSLPPAASAWRRVRRAAVLAALLGAAGLSQAAEARRPVPGLGRHGGSAGPAPSAGPTAGLAEMACTVQAIAQNVEVTLPSTPTVMVTAAQVDNGSTGTCGPLTYGLQKVVSGQVDEGGNLTLTAPAGKTFKAVTFASYGTPIRNGDGTYSQGSCHAATSQAVVEAALLGKNTATIPATNNTFGNPCAGSFKALAVQAIYGDPLPELTYTCAEAGNNVVLLVVNDASGNQSVAPALVNVVVPTLAATTWTGAAPATTPGANTDWNNCQNWSYGQVPSATISAVIPAGATTYPNLSAGTAAAADITINPSGRLTVGPSATLRVMGNWTNNGTATLAGTVTFVGSAATQTVGGSTNTSFASVEVNKASGAVQLSRSLTVRNNLAMTSGTLLTTGAYQVALGGAAMLYETETSFVTGQVATTRTLNAGTAEDFGGLGLTLTPADGSVAPGLTRCVRTTGAALSGVGTGASVQRYFDLQATVSAGLSVDVDFAYFDHELNGLSASQLTLFKSGAGLGGPWVSQAPVSRAANLVSKVGLTDLAALTLGGNDTPLPVELSYFAATAGAAGTVHLAWTTASEKNCVRFEVERSANGREFGRIGTVAAAGSSQAAHAYRLTDAALPGGAALLYYRLRQVDADGTEAYSPVRTVALATGGGLALAPNPAHASTTLTGAAPGARVLVLDALGRLALSTQADATGTATLALPPSLPAGVYVVRAGASAARLTVD